MARDHPEIRPHSQYHCNGDPTSLISLVELDMCEGTMCAYIETKRIGANLMCSQLSFHYIYLAYKVE